MSLHRLECLNPELSWRAQSYGLFRVLESLAKCPQGHSMVLDIESLALYVDVPKAETGCRSRVRIGRTNTETGVFDMVCLGWMNVGATDKGAGFDWGIVDMIMDYGDQEELVGNPHFFKRDLVVQQVIPRDGCSDFYMLTDEEGRRIPMGTDGISSLPRKLDSLRRYASTRNTASHLILTPKSAFFAGPKPLDEFLTTWVGWRESNYTFVVNNVFRSSPHWVHPEVR